ncbi:MAG: methyltransferase domain-containing protein [Stellaceae bacterium]
MIRERIKEHCGQSAEILTLRRAPIFGSTLFVADCMRHGRLTRMLGSIDRTGRIMEQSAMDLLRPEKLVFGYERLMLGAFALVREPRTALLLGLGGGAMCRHLAAYVPECDVTVVERDPIVQRIARRYFHVARSVVMADAAQVVAAARHVFDVVLVDLYDAGGAADTRRRFWKDCLRALRPGGALAVNWAEFVGATRLQQEALAIAGAIGRSFFIAERVARPNVIQLVPTARGFSLTEFPTRLKRFAEAHNLPREDRDILRRNDIMRHNPLTAWTK